MAPQTPNTKTPRAAEAIEAVRRDGYVILENILSAGELYALREALASYLDCHFGRNRFEGRKTERVYTLVAKGKPFADLVEHPLVLEVCDAFLKPNYLLTASQAIRIHPGEAPQGFHTDDSFFPMPRPRPPLSMATIWAVDDFTADNGATRIIPKSHLWGDERPAGAATADDFLSTQRYGLGGAEGELNKYGAGDNPIEAAWIPAVMPAGSVILFAGTLWHGGGPNTSSVPRTAVSNQYGQPWARQQENFTLAVPPDQASAMSERVQELLGYSIHPPFMGHIGGVHPKRLLKKKADPERA
ncbi:MAG: phytanoyl-CoA dioxygenase family protein [Polyangiaceae bacterium]|nr:phytanoyl-CoA dioxygenase family protein [Polyangiaceae bacterium]